jgi:predicted nucleic acid-binding Zn ribbon protein
LAQKASGSAPPHKHCRVCGISIATSKEYCSDECRDIDAGGLKKMKNYRRLTMGMMILAIAALFIFTIYLRLRG